MEKYFGFRVRVSDFLEPEDYALIKDQISTILANVEGDTQYRIYLHQLVIDAQSSKLGIPGGLAGRIEKILLRFSINPKQRRTGDIKFMNYRFEKVLHEIDHYYMPHEIGYTLPAEFFATKGYFQNTLVTLVRVGMREQHKKIKIRVAVEPTLALIERLTREDQIDKETNIELDFKRAREFNRQTKIFFGQFQENEMKDAGEPTIKPQKFTVKAKNIGNVINQPGSPISAPVSFSDNPVVIEHLLHEIRQLSRSIRENPPAKASKEDLTLIAEIATKNSPSSESISRIKEVGGWVASRAEKLGLSLLTEYLKQQAGL